MTRDDAYLRNRVWLGDPSRSFIYCNGYVHEQYCSFIRQSFIRQPNLFNSWRTTLLKCWYPITQNATSMTLRLSAQWSHTPALLAFGLKSSTSATGCNLTPFSSSFTLPAMTDRMLVAFPLYPLAAEFCRDLWRAMNSCTQSRHDRNKSRHPNHHSLNN